MADFTALDNSEALLGRARRNSSGQCPKGGDVAAIIGGVVTAGALTAVAVDVAQNYLTAGGVGDVTAEAQAAAGEDIASAQAEATSLAASAKNKAAEAVKLGPGTEANAAVDSAQADTAAAQQRAQQLAGEAKVAANARIAEGQAAIANAQQYGAQKQAELQSLAANPVDTAKAFAAAVGVPAEPPPGLVPPAFAESPEAALQEGIRESTKAVSEQVPETPAKDLKIQAPQSISAQEAAQVMQKTGTDPVEEAALEEQVLTKEELDQCRATRDKVVSDIERMFRVQDAFYQRIQPYVQSSGAIPAGDRKKVSSGFLGLGSTLLVRAYIYVAEMYRYGKVVPGASTMVEGAMNRALFHASEDVLRRKNFGPLVGSLQWNSLRKSVTTAAKYTATCEQVRELHKASSQVDAFLVDFNALVELFLTFVDSDDEEALKQLGSQIITAWGRITDRYYLSFPLAVLDKEFESSATLLRSREGSLITKWSAHVV